MGKFRRMEIFVAIVEAGQLTRAANNLHLSKSAVSQSLTVLEDYLDTQLLMRKNSAWQLTEAGSTYYRKSKKILRAVEAFDDDAQQVRQSLSGLIRISSPDTFGSYVLTPIISKFMEMHPNIVIELNHMEVITDLIEKRVDIAFRSPLEKTSDPENSKLDIHKIGKTEMVICSSPTYLKTFGTPKTHSDLKKHKCILYTRIPTWTLSKNGRNYEHTPAGHLIIDNAETIRELCIHGQGLTFMSATLAAGPIKKGRLVPILEDYDCYPTHIQAVRIKDKHAPARVIQLLNFIIDELRLQSSGMLRLV